MLHLQTQRLDLLALTDVQLRLLVDDLAQAEQHLGLPMAPAILTDPVPRAIAMKLKKTAQASRRDHPWLTYWLIIVREAGVGAGLAGFKGVPDAAGEVEIGYGIDPAFRGQGFMTEAVQALIGWAFAQPGCHSVVAVGTLKSNVASHRVLEKVGMQVYEEAADTLSWRLGKPAHS